MRSVYLFNRSLRIDDNLGLLAALSESEYVIPVFCVDPRQAIPENNQYFSKFSLGFMMQSLEDLDTELQKYKSKLLMLFGEPHIVLPKLFKQKKLDKLYINEDYTPFARERFTQLSDVLDVVEVKDHLLWDPNTVRNKAGRAFKVYTPFLNAVESKKTHKPVKIAAKYLQNLAKHNTFKILQNQTAWKMLRNNSEFSIYFTGGRREGLSRLKYAKQSQKNYDLCRNYLNYQTTMLSPYIKFGCISIREAWQVFKQTNVVLCRELIWREFYYHYYIAYPDELEWNNHKNTAILNTGAPLIVKACLNQLTITGYLHNRGRMILAHYLLQKNYWKSGDKLFAVNLVDYDPIVNIGNWKWIAKQPNFKRLKPNVQQQKYDKPCPAEPKNNIQSYTDYWNSFS